MNPIVDTKEGVIIFLAARTGAGRDEVLGESGGRFRVAVRAVPEKGKANSAIISLLARRLRVGKESIRIVSGAALRQKAVSVRGISPDEARSRLS